MMRSMVKSNSFFFLIVLFFVGLFWSCSRRPNIQGEGDPLFQGVWKQEKEIDTLNRISFTNHQIKFTCDSFYLSMITYSKANYYAEECYNDGVWKEYAKGTYTYTNDTLSLSGLFTKPNFKQKISGCYRSGRYFHQFLISKLDEEKIEFRGIQEKSQFILNKKEHIDCVPKPL